MDRSDEMRDDDYYEHADDRFDRSREDDTRDEHLPAGDVLGIANANPPRDRVRSRDDSAGVAIEKETGRAGSREVQRSPGATSIDMGAGGTGTDVERP